MWQNEQANSPFFGQQYLNKVLGRGVKQGGKGSNEETRKEDMGWRIVHSGGDLVSPEGSIHFEQEGNHQLGIMLGILMWS